MIKAFGIILVALSVFLLGQSYSSSLCRKSAVEDAFCALLYHIRSNIEYSCAPLHKICSNFSNDTLESCGFFKRLSEDRTCFALKNALLESNGGENKKEVLSVDKEFFSLLCDFADEIGKSPTPSAGCECCERYIALLEAHISQTRAERKKLAAIIQKLSVFAAAFCALLLL